MKTVVVFGKYPSGYLDNSKYLFNYFLKNNPHFDFYFVAETPLALSVLKEYKIPYLSVENPRHLEKIRSSNMWILVDWLNGDFFKNLLKEQTKIFQLWHGLPLKNIKAAIEEGNVKVFPNYNDYFLSTSPFFTKIFEKIFKFKQPLEFGYPRNDVLLRNTTEADLINIDLHTYEKIKNFKEKKSKIGVFMSTLTYTGFEPLLTLNLEKLNKALRKLDIFLVLKLHPTLSIDEEFLKKNFSNLIVYKSHADIYPILKLSDFLITNYSSVYFDYLFLDKPIIFFVEDLPLMKDKIILDFEAFTPGEKVYNFPSLIRSLKKLVKGSDTYKEKRKEILDLSFTYLDPLSAKRITEFVNKTLFS